jgi:HPt (histidine-containing phosphotransfer) domain-containing protein
MADINALLKKLREEYLENLPARLDEMETQVLALRNKSDAETLQTLYRDVHSTKGSAGTHGVLIITSICHQFEDELGEKSAGKETIDDDCIDNWLSYIDLIRTARERTIRGDDTSDDIEARLHELRKSVNAKSYTCLLVDPAASSFGKIIEGILKECSINLSYMNDGYQALGRLLVNKFDILISGMELETMNGVGLIAAVKSSKSVNKNIPSILITSGDYDRTGRKTDPEYVIKKDVKLPETIKVAIKEIIRKLI